MAAKMAHFGIFDLPATRKVEKIKKNKICRFKA